MSIDARAMISGGLLIDAIGESRRNALEQADIYCPGNNNECVINCNEYGCVNSNFYAHSETSKFNVFVNGRNALLSSKIFYLTNVSTEYSIYASGSGTNMLSNTEIYSSNGLNNIAITCNYSTSINDACYAFTNPPQLFCKSNHGSTCSLQLQTGTYNNWGCVLDENVCNDTVPDGYYGNVFICNEANECEGKNLKCSDNEDCYIYCTRSSACKSANMYAPNNGNLYVSCKSTSADGFICQSASIYGPTNGNLTIDCNSGNQGYVGCRYLDIICPTNGICDVTCTKTPGKDWTLMVFAKYFAQKHQGKIGMVLIVIKCQLMQEL
eukprot:182195_1